MSSDSQTNNFNYAASLTSTSNPSIRLLILLPARNDDESIRCQLAEHSFDETCPEYETLSYVWGDPSDLHDVQCNDQIVKVTLSLYQALHHLRQPEERVLWIDQITINQNDSQEKSQQVAMMGDIFRRSRHTIAWLGMPQPGYTQGFAVLGQLAGSVKAAWTKKGARDEFFNHYQGDLSEKMRIMTRNAETVFPPVSRPESEAVNTVLANPWFSRMWIMQEATLSPSLTFSCGQLRIKFDDVLYATFGLLLLHMGNRRPRKSMKDLFKLWSLAELRSQYRNSRMSEAQIVNVIATCRFRQATEFRDRFYALFGMTSTNMTQLGIAPDYVSSTRDAISKVVVKLLQHDNSLRLLELTECNRRANDDLPSWIPPERRISDPELFQISSLPVDPAVDKLMPDAVLGMMQEDPEAEPEIIANLRASLKNDEADKPVCTFCPPIPGVPVAQLAGDGVLSIQGQVLDTIEEVSAVVLNPAGMGNGFGAFDIKAAILEEFPDGFEAPQVTPHTWLGSLIRKAGVDNLGVTSAETGLRGVHRYYAALAGIERMVTGRKSRAYPTGEPLMSVYRRTITADLQLMSEQQSVAMFNKWRKILVPEGVAGKIRHVLQAGEDTGLISSVLVTGIVAQALFSMETRLFYNEMVSLFGRRIAWTKKGYLALVPPRTSVGDTVFALRGGDMPFVLTKNGDVWEMLGPSYVHGIMDGSTVVGGVDSELKIV